MSNTVNKGLVPQLRFPEFESDGNWLLKQLKYVCEMKAGKFVKASNINPKNSNSSYPCYGGNGLRGFTQSYTHDGIFSLIGRQGALCGNINLTSNKFHATEHAVVVSPKVHIDTHWLFFSLIHLNLNQYATGQAQPGLSIENIERVQLPVPIEEYEQQKIAKFLTSIDNLLITHTKKLDTIKAHKKGLMQQLFPAEGETVPKLRFARFSNDGNWEKRNFSTLFEIGGGKDHKHLPDGDIPVYGSGGYMRSANSFLYDGESACIGRKGTINKPMFLQGKFWTVDTLFYTHTFKDCSPKFVYLLFQNINWLELNEAGGVPSLSKVIINKVEVRVPSIDEQNEIVETIWSIDRVTYEQEQKITTLNNHKKGLMQKLFPAVNKEHNL